MQIYRIVGIGGFALAVAACSPSKDGFPNADIKACEAFIKAQLKNPTTYVPVAVSRRDAPISVDDFMALKGLKRDDDDRILIGLAAEKGLQLRVVKLESTFEDVSYLREHRLDECAFQLTAGKLQDRDMLNRIADHAAGDRRFRMIVNAGLAPNMTPEELEPELKYPCCL